MRAALARAKRLRAVSRRLDNSPYRAIDWFKHPRGPRGHRPYPAGTFQFESCRKTTTQAYVLNDLMLAMMLFNHLGVTGCLQRRALFGLASQVDDIGLKLLLKIQRMTSQFIDVQEHCETSASILPTHSAEARQVA